MFNALKRAVSGVSDAMKAEISRFADAETAEAVVAVALAVAHADGTFEPEERAKLDQILRTHPMMTQFDNGLVGRKVGQLMPLFEIDPEAGIDACMKELRDVGTRGDIDKRRAVIRLGIAIAKSDGEVEPAERTVLLRACRELEISAGDVGL